MQYLIVQKFNHQKKILPIYHLPLMNMLNTLHYLHYIIFI
jgi:hypothetical protein